MGQLNEPLWVRVIVLGCVLAMAAFGAVGLVLADIGLFEPVLWVVLGVLAFIGLARLARPLARAEGEPTEASKVGAIGAIVIALGTMYWNGVNAAKHVQINRDGALYLNAGKWIAKHGTLNVKPFVAPFTSSAPFTASSTGMKLHGNHLEFDLSHMLSALLAEAQNVGGNRLMFLTVPIFGGISVLVFYLLAARLLRHPFAALAATATLAFVMPQISFSRDSTSEIPTQILLFTAIWLLGDRRTLRGLGTGFCAGLLLGLIQAIHGDGLAFLLGVPILFAVLWLRAKRADRRLLKRGFIGAAMGAAVGYALAAIDFALWNRYYLSILHGNIERLAAAGVLISAGSVAAVMVHRRRPHLVERARAKREPAAKVAAVLVLLFGFGGWFIRPYVQKIHAGKNDVVGLVQRLNHLPVDPTRRYAELSMRWISWYIGPLTLTLGIVAAAALARQFVRGKLRVPPLTTAAILAPPALLYIWRPSITPDQVWASRRFLPAVFPGLILLAFGLLCVVARDRVRPNLTERRVLVVIIAVAAVAFPLYTVRNLTQMTEQRGLFPVITDTCRLIGPKGAVVILEEAQTPQSVAYLADSQTLRSFCDVPVIVLLGRPRPIVLRTLASEWASKGRTLYMVAEYQQAILKEFPQAQIEPSIIGQELHLLEPTLLRRPTHYTSDQYHITAVTQLMVAAVPRATRNLSPAG